MSGSSLWLIPPQPSEFNTAAQELISTSIPRLFAAVECPSFIPHVTLTSSIDASKTYNDKPQQWLDGLPLFSASADTNIPVRLGIIEPGERFFQKLILKASRDDQLVQLAAACRTHGVEFSDSARAKAWAEAEYLPHLSLMYADIGINEVANQYAAVEAACRDAFDRLVGGDSVLCSGGRIVLVDTTKPIEDWTLLAARAVPGVNWIWNLQTRRL